MTAEQKEKKRIRDHERYLLNREEIMRKSHTWRDANPEKNRAAENAWRAENRPHVNLLARQRYAANPEKAKAQALSRYHRRKDKVREQRRLQRYGLTSEQYEALLQKQNGRCAICDREITLCIDHCHSTGKVRGLLCRICNSTLGLFEESIERFSRAITYLKESH